MFTAAYGVFQLVYGPIGDRFGKYRVIAWACAISAAHDAGVRARADVHAARRRALSRGRHRGGRHSAVDGVDRRQRRVRRTPAGARAFPAGPDARHRRGLAARRSRRRALRLLGAVRPAGRVERARERDPVPAAARSAGRRRRDVAPFTLQEFAAGIAYVWRRRWARVVLVSVFLEGLFMFGSFAFIATHLHIVTTASRSRSQARS